MMNSLKWTSIDLVVDASPGPLASGINSELSVPLLTSIVTAQDGTKVLENNRRKRQRWGRNCVTERRRRWKTRRKRRDGGGII